MAPWTDQSRFSTLISTHQESFSPSLAGYLGEDQPGTPADYAPRQFLDRGPSVNTCAQRLREILKFAEDLQVSHISMQSEQIFAELQPFRRWLFWMPVTLVKAHDMPDAAMVLFA